jgi:hypothetical protein
MLGGPGAVKFFAAWQPPEREDAQTALAFGFLRHAPVAHALHPWLTEVLERPVRADPLEPEHFWPSYDSVLEGHHWTEPELVFDADDGEPLVVVVEVKPGLGMHTFPQISREVVDVAASEGARRVALVMIGADLGEPAEVAQWRTELRAALDRSGLDRVEAELRYSSWERVGAAVSRCGAELDEWRRYAEDVVTHLRLQGLLGYDGGPVFDDLEDVTVVNAVEAFNRTIRAARQLLLTIVSRPRFHAAGYAPFGGSFSLLRDGRSTALAQDEDFFTTTVALSPFTKPGWPRGAGVYVALDLASADEPYLQAGAFLAKRNAELIWDFAYAEENDELTSEALVRTDKAVLPWAAMGRQTEWVYAARPWRAGDGDADVRWALDMLEAGSRAWDAG